MPIFKKCNEEFFKKWSPNMAYVLGFLYADGTISQSKRGSRYLAIQIIDKGILYSIRSALGSEHKISVRKSVESNVKTLYRLQIGNQDICDSLNKLGMCGNKTKNMVLPDVPSKYTGDFVRGYFDGDGNVWIGFVNKSRKNWTKVIYATFTSCSVGFLRDLKRSLKDLGLRGGCISKTKKSAYRLQYSTRDALHLYQIMYNNRHQHFLCLERKKKKFDNYAVVA